MKTMKNLNTKEFVDSVMRKVDCIDDYAKKIAELKKEDDVRYKNRIADLLMKFTNEYKYL